MKNPVNAAKNSAIPSAELLNTDSLDADLVAGLDTETVRAHLKAAHDTVSDLCRQRRKWVMSIPARPDYDPDLVIGQALRDGDRLLKLALKGVCVYCGEIMQYESLEQKAGDEGNQLRIEHIRQCSERPELKLIAYVERLRAALTHALQTKHDIRTCACVKCESARAALALATKPD